MKTLILFLLLSLTAYAADKKATRALPAWTPPRTDKPAEAWVKDPNPKPLEAILAALSLSQMPSSRFCEPILGWFDPSKVPHPSA